MKRMTPLLPIALPLALALALLGAVPAVAITRNSVLARAQGWVDVPVRYSQAKRHLGYRTDCSGYVSMCWKTGTSWSTKSFHSVTRCIKTSQLKPGDAMLKKGYHIRLFYGWTDASRTSYVAYEAGSGTVAVCRIHNLAEDLAFGYVPTRYGRVSDSPASSNLVKNGSFNSWASSWGSRADQPVWWQTNSSWWQTLANRDKSTYRSARASLRLSNPNADPAAFSELSQSTSVTAGATYRLTAWAKTAFDPSGLELRLTYLNAVGESVAETTIAGDRSGINGASFGRMTVQAAAPGDAVSALIAVRLAGSSTTDASGTVVPGVSAALDDVSLVRR